ncbi:MAG: glutamate--tRNA ligase [Paludibacteraceae bacterium]|jgi:glutamyl-tRNA synthetase|nr:glutamate--tRNA ligase [Paludibacteraceae bacterium]
MERQVRVRFAPSPTGALHIGGVRTALYNYLFARQHGGVMLLRIEDTDSTRFVPGAEEYILESLDWLGIEIDEGLRAKKSKVESQKSKAGIEIEAVGSHGPYRQSERREIYHQYVRQLLDSGHAYIAFDTPEELEAKRAEIPNFQYDARTRMMMRNSLTMPAEEVKALMDKGEKYVVRFLVEPNEDVHVHDLIRGEVVINSNILDDKVLYKSADDLPTYHLANIVDDHLMEISHVIRGEEWLPSAPLHVLLYRAFGWQDTMPQFAHLPLLLKPDGNGKLSKRDGDRLGFPVFPLEFHNQKDGTVSSGYRESGYLPEAVINFLALLGWHGTGDQELYTMDELIREFSLDRVSKSGAKFDYEKGKWFNHQYLQLRTNEELAEMFLPTLKEKLAENGLSTFDFSLSTIAKVIGLTKDRVNFVPELWEQTNFFFLAPTEYDEKSLKKRWKEDSPRHMTEMLTLLEPISEEDWHRSYETQDDNGNTVIRWHLDDIIMPWIAEQEYGVGIVMNAFRICLVGAARGPHIWNITDVLGKEETLRRVKDALKILR